ncbi:hypothetical protein CAEBREN_06132 [Caenorhabditis brenneri]|uniref:IST1 homolog n=1 Tax=Caenorhabditis brenneri TaxID=135651 RepID=G0MTC2_CAEBE|nr:hypothetical protein CAEBREN_06132 [Caenorhabditis brenneri]
MWAAPRLHFDISEFNTISDQLTIKYGKPFAEAARANQLEFPARVNPKVISKLLSAAPPNLLVERYMIEVAAAAGVPFVPDPDVMREDEVHQADQILIDFETADGNCRQSVESTLPPTIPYALSGNGNGSSCSREREYGWSMFSQTGIGAQITSKITPSACSMMNELKTHVVLFSSKGKQVSTIDGFSLEQKGKSMEFEKDVTAIASSESHLAVATEKELHLLPIDGDASCSIKFREIINRLLFTGHRIIAIDATSGVNVIMINGSKWEMEHRWAGDASFETASACLPRSYINKMLIGSQSSCNDQVAVGCENGMVLLLELNKKKIRCSMSHDGAISSIAFRCEQKTTMLVGEVTGKVSIWNFFKEHLLSTCQAHSDAIDLLCFHKGNSFLSMSSGSIKVWKIVVNGEPKLLKERQPAANATEIEQTEEVEMVWDEKTSIDALSETPRMASIPSWKCDWQPRLLRVLKEAPFPTSYEPAYACMPHPTPESQPQEDEEYRTVSQTD